VDVVGFQHHGVRQPLFKPDGNECSTAPNGRYSSGGGSAVLKAHHFCNIRHTLQAEAILIVSCGGSRVRIGFWVGIREATTNDCIGVLIVPHVV